MLLVSTFIIAILFSFVFWEMIAAQLLHLERESVIKFLMTKFIFRSLVVVALVAPQLEPQLWSWVFLGIFCGQLAESWDELKNG